MRRPICDFALGYPEFRQKSVQAPQPAVLRPSYGSLQCSMASRQGGSLWRNFRNGTLSHLTQIEFSE